jgi:tellurite resistance-related uncharacterized protein
MSASAAKPYKRTPVFDENTLPAGLRREHRTEPGVWGIIRVLEGHRQLKELRQGPPAMDHRISKPPQYR